MSSTISSATFPTVFTSFSTIMQHEAEIPEFDKKTCEIFQNAIKDESFAYTKPLKEKIRARKYCITELKYIAKQQSKEIIRMLKATGISLTSVIVAAAIMYIASVIFPPLGALLIGAGMVFLAFAVSATSIGAEMERSNELSARSDEMNYKAKRLSKEIENDFYYNQEFFRKNSLKLKEELDQVIACNQIKVDSFTTTHATAVKTTKTIQDEINRLNNLRINQIDYENIRITVEKTNPEIQLQQELLVQAKSNQAKICQQLNTVTNISKSYKRAREQLNEAHKFYVLSAYN